MGVLRQLLIVVVLAGIGGGVWIYFNPLSNSANSAVTDPAQRNGKKKSKPAPVLVRPVSYGEETIAVEAIGTGRAMKSVTLFANTAGRVSEVNFAAGDFVKAGKRLLKLDQKSELLAVELAEVRLAEAKRNFNRLKRLRASSSVTQSAVETAQSGLEASEIQLKQAKTDLADRTVVAPFSGHLGLTELNIGDRIDTDTAIVTLDERSTLLIKFDIPEALLGRVRQGDPVTLVPWSDLTQVHEGLIFDVDSRVDENSRTFQLRAGISNKDDTLRPGMSFRVSLVIKGGKYPAVPEIAIQWGGNGSFIWVIRDGRAQKLPVVIVQRQQEAVLIDAEVNTGDRIVVEGLHRMRDGRKVSATDVSTGS